MASAGCRVMHTIELLEQVLASVDTSDAEGVRFLLLCQRVNKTWHDIIKKNQAIQQALFLSCPAQDDLSANGTFNPLLWHPTGEQTGLRFADGSKLSISIIEDTGNNGQPNLSASAYLCSWEHALSILRSPSTTAKPSFGGMYLANNSYVVDSIKGFHPMHWAIGRLENPTITELCEALEKSLREHKYSVQHPRRPRFPLAGEGDIPRAEGDVILSSRSAILWHITPR